MSRQTALVVLLPCALLTAAPGIAALPFDQVVIDPANPADPHCKTLGDIDGDGQLDAVAASSAGGGMFWYEYPGWTKHTIRATGSWTTDMQAGDVDGDGDLDLVIPDSAALKWYENPRPAGDPRTDPWSEHTIGVAGANHHDVELADLEPDGDLDVVTREKGGNGTYFWRQGITPTTWIRVTISTQSGEGIGLGDIDGDGDVDVAQNGRWVEQVSPTSWSEHTIDAGAPADVGVLVADLDGNGTNDVVIAPSESSSGVLSWFEAIDPKTGPWIEHPVDSTVSFLHTFKAADVDRDGDLDLVTAEMHQSSNPDEVSVYFNNGLGAGWTQQVLADTGSHNVRAGDIGGDGDIDVFGANWNDSAPNSAVLEMWENQSAPLALDQWRRHIVETSLPWNSVFVEGRDLNGDGLPDLVVGGWWYPNPGSLGGSWTRTTIGAPLHNLAAVHDFDRDGDLDVLGTNGQVGGEDLSWAENDGIGGFTIRDITNAATGGDFLQGVSIYQVLAGGQEEVVLSWHNGGSGTALLAIPDDPTTTAWPLTMASATTNQEEVPTGDLDADGDIDIHLGTTWLRQDPGGNFTVQGGITLSGGGVPDRVKLADLDGDGDLDVVIGVEFGTALVWGENDGAGGGWTEHAIAADFDYFSVDVGDVDHDGDVDVVGGAHMSSGQVSLYENDGTGLGWTTHTIDSGDSSQIDHHDGTRLVDMDLDGDLDVISVGWSKRSLVIYENRALGAGSGGDTTPPTLLGAHALGRNDRVIIDFSEPLAQAAAENAANYQISDGVTVLSAELDGNQRAVTLTTTLLTAGTSYVLTVDDVLDLAANPIAPGSTAVFELGAGDPDPDLVAHWPLDEGAGSIALDVSGNGHHGFLTDGAGWGAGPSGSFDGVDDHVDAGAFDVAGSALTLAAWIKADGFANCSSRDCRILSKATGTAEADHVFMLSTIASASDTRLRFRLRTGGATSTLIASSGNLVAGQWLHVAAVYDGVDLMLFLDGQPVGNTAKSGTVSQDPALPVWIGGNPTDPASKPFDGLIDDVRIYQRALSAAELRALPPPSVEWIFADGFESGDVSAWSADAGAIDTLPAAARTGARGARVAAGTSCAGDDFVVLEPPTTTLQGPYEACRTLVARAVEVVSPGAVLRAGEWIGLDNDFSTSADLTLELDAGLAPFAWLRDDSPASESTYIADFHLNADALTLAGGDRLEHLVGGSASGASFRLVLQPDGAGGVEALLEARRDDGTFAVTPGGAEVAVPAGWHRWRLEWEAGAGDGRLALHLDGVEVASLDNLTNGVRRVDSVSWGVVAGPLAGDSGSLDLDGFSSWR